MADFEAIFELDDIDKIDCIFDINATVYDYPTLANLPQINGETLIGNKTSEDLHLASSQSIIDVNNRIDTIVESFDGDIERLEQNIQSEATTRAENDTLLQNNINTLDEKVDGINANLTQQIEETQQDVNDKYNELIRDIDDLTDVVEEDYNTLNQRITDVADELNQTIEENVVALQQEDAALQNQINAHSTTLTAYDTRITNNANAIVNLNNELDNKQDVLISGENIKTLNNQSLLGSGNIDITSAQWGNITGTLSNQTDLQDEFQNIREVAEGKTKSYVVSYANNPIFNTQDAEIKLDSIFTDINNITHNIEELKLGDNIFVQETDVPDRWCSQPSKGESTLPEDYTQLEYIKSTGTQYIDTGIIFDTLDTKVEIGIDVTSISKDTFGFSNPTKDTNWYALYTNNFQAFFGTTGGNVLGNLGSGISGVKRDIVLTTDANKRLQVKVNNLLQIDKNFTGDYIVDNQKSFAILTANGNLTTSRCTSSQLWYTRLYKNDTLVFNGIPAKRNSDETIGMYDLVSEQFFTNAGTGTFIAGGVIEKSVTLYKLETSKVDLTEYATKKELVAKQDVITDLGDIRNNIATNTSNISYLDEKVRDIELFKFPNAVIIGEPTISNGQVSGFSTMSYLQFPFILDLHNQAFQIDFSFTTATNVQTQQNILDSNFGLALAIQNGKGVMAISSNGTSWDIGSTTGTMTIQSNTTYYARLIWNRLQYKTQLSTDGVNYIDDMIIVDTRSPYPRTIFIGGCDQLETGHTPHPFLGTINMNKAFMSVMGNIIWQGMDDAGLSTRADLSLSNLDELGEKRFTDLQNDINTRALNSNLTAHTSNGTIHVTASDKIAWSQKQNTSDNDLTTTNKTVVGAINELNNGKQDTISDLSTIRAGASKGATALQSVPSNYVTDTQLATKQDKLTAGSAIGIDNNEVAVKLFDKSKFTVVGSPTITDDGVASGFNSSNYIKFPSFNNSNFSIIFPILLSAISENARLFEEIVTTTYISRITILNGKPHLLIANSEGTNWAINKNGKTNLNTNTQYYIRFSYDGTIYRLDISNDLKNWTNEIEVTNSTLLRNVEWKAISPIESIDLSQFSITVDGQEVLSGTQTIYNALDNKSPLIYNAQAFNVIGSPTITDNGVASGFSNNNYLRANTNTSYQGTFEISIGYERSASDTDSSVFQSINGHQISITQYKGKILLWLSSNGTSWDIASGLGYDGLVLQAGVKYIITLKHTVDKYILLIKNTNTNETSVSLSINSSLNIYNSSSLNNIGFSGSWWPVSKSSIDLKQFSITVDDKEILNGTLTGTKDINSVITTYENGASGYRIWSDGWCIQTGFVSADGIVSLIKTYKNTDYAITFGSLGEDGVPRAGTRRVNSFDYTSANQANTQAFWCTMGYLADGQY